MTKVFNKTNEKDKRRLLRKTMPKAEVLLWMQLKGKAVGGHKFRRQYSVGGFVMDFYCPKLKLAIEVDGGSHFTEGADSYDKERQSIIESYGIEFLRFTNNEIYDNLGWVMGMIEQCIEKTSPAPSLVRRGC